MVAAGGGRCRRAAGGEGGGEPRAPPTGKRASEGATCARGSVAAAGRPAACVGAVARALAARRVVVVVAAGGGGQMSARGLRGESRRSPLSLVFAFVDALRDLFVWHFFTLILFFAVAEVFLNVFLLFVLWFVVAFGVGCCRVVKSKATEKFIEEVNFSPPPLESANVTLEKVCRCDGPRGGLPKS